MQNYQFTKVEMDFDKPISDNLSLGLKPRGVFDSNALEYHLFFEFVARSGRHKLIHITCKALFTLSSSDIPDYFYANSIAIVFPYIRAFVSTISLQANIGRPIVLPTYNLSSLKDQLLANTSSK